MAKLLRRSEEGARVAELCAEFGISRATLFRIRARYGIHPEGLARVLDLERESRRARHRSQQLVAEVRALQDLVQTCLCSAAERHAAVALLVSRHGLSERRSCDLLGLHRSTLRRREERAEPGDRGDRSEDQ
jgi:transposase-like protein